ncbi:transcriptional regulator [Burkholderia pseudomultivorans]|uniref:Transcriptional regulator n=1 Tax=Burkholderia pseudomultivorans TaxID=1207504 RepID=A0A132EJI6_9BURK|nr:helix-turn-helix domain-containing protein [Burkholderia pseudomultivorans]KWF33065.1 transcriptional regulator [Burkholderia pseudomultivorans]
MRSCQGFLQNGQGRSAGADWSVRARREAIPLSREALADLAEIDRFQMAEIERGERNVTILDVLRISPALGWKPSELLADVGL